MATEKQGITTADFAAGLFELDGATEYKNMMVYGGSGVGKTVLAGSCPGKLLFLAGEPGYISAARLGARGKARVIPDPATAVAAASWLEEGNANRLDWLVVDGLGTMQNKFLLAYAAEAFDANPAKRAHRNLPDKPDYYNAQNFIKHWVARLIDLPCNVLFTAHAMFPEDKETGEQLIYPGIQGKGYEVSNYVAGLMHAVGYMSPRIKKTAEGAIEVRRVLWRTVKDPDSDVTIFAKDQFNALGTYTDITDDFRMPEIIDLIDKSPTSLAEPEPVAVKAPAARSTRTNVRRAPARR